MFDALVWKDYACTHFVGRNHAGVGNYCGDFGPQQLFDAVGDVGIEPLSYHYALCCTRCDGIVSERVCHDSTHHVEPSETALRDTLARGERPPPELMRPEVAETVLNTDERVQEEYCSRCS